MKALYQGVDLRDDIKNLQVLDDPTKPPVILPYILIDQNNERYFISPPELTGDDIMHKKVW